MTDQDLITRYSTTHDQQAFAELAQRHSPWVYSCAKRILHNTAPGDDVTQAVFILLATKSSKLQAKSHLAGWLFRATQYCAREAMRSHARRQKHEQEAAMQQQTSTPASDANWQEISPVLDEAVAKLSAKDRDAVLLHFYQGLSLSELATTLGTGEEAARKRVQRAVGKRRTILAHKGISASATGLALVMTESVTQAAPAEVTEAAIAASGGSVAESAGVIAKGAMKMMVLTKMKVAALVVATGLLAGGIIAGAVAAGTGQQTTQNTADTVKQPQNPRTIKVHIVDDDGKPVEGVNVHTGIWTKEPFKANRDYKSDATGLAVAELPSKMYILRVWASKDGYVPMFTHWEQEWFDAGRAAPDEVTITLKSGTTIGGFVKNEEGQPIVGARIGVMTGFGPEPQTMADMWLASGDDARITDAKGRWTLSNVPEGDLELRVSVTHSDYVSDLKWGGLQDKQNVKSTSLRDQTATIVMQRGTSLTGQVTDAQGKGIAGAVVVWGDNPYDDTGYHSEHRQEVRTDANGIYRLQPLPPMPLTVTVVAQGWMPELQKTTIAPEGSKLDFQLKKGKTLRLRFVDRQGKPIPDVYVGIVGWRNCKSLYNVKHPNVLETPIPRSADQSGVFEWAGAPDDAVEYSIGKEGYKAIAKSLVADDTEQSIQLDRE